jgi:hypothetical protein
MPRSQDPILPFVQELVRRANRKITGQMVVPHTGGWLIRDDPEDGDDDGLVLACLAEPLSGCGSAQAKIVAVDQNGYDKLTSTLITVHDRADVISLQLGMPGSSAPAGTTVLALSVGNIGYVVVSYGMGCGACEQSETSEENSETSEGGSEGSGCMVPEKTLALLKTIPGFGPNTFLTVDDTGCPVFKPTTVCTTDSSGS